MRKAIKAHKNLHTNQQNEHAPANQNATLDYVWGGQATGVVDGAHGFLELFVHRNDTLLQTKLC